MKTITELLMLCPKVQYEKARETRILNASAGLSRSGLRTIRAVVQRVSEKGAHDKHRVEIQCVEPDTLLGEGYVKVWCDCGFQVFYGQEVLLTKQGASSIRYSDGSMPNIRNPGGVMMLCHHTLRIALAIRSKKL